MTRRALIVLLAGVLMAPTLPAQVGHLQTPGDGNAQTTTSDVLERGLEQKLDPTQGLIVHLDEPPPELEELPGLEVRYRFQSLQAVYAVGTSASLHALAAMPSVTFVEDAWKPIEYQLPSSTIASRAREVFDPSFDPPDKLIDEPSPALWTPSGERIDGDGVGIAVIDTGIDATHPAFQDEGKIGQNYVVTPEGVREGGAYTELGSAHGTHIAGIAAGNGAGIPTPAEGAAPNATLYTFANRAELSQPGGSSLQGTVLSPAIAMDWIASNADQISPQIEVLVNAWSCRDGACRQLNPDQAHVKLASKLASETGVTVFFPAGNSGGQGDLNQVTPEARIPTPGVIGVAIHDDEDKGSRTNCIDSDSSRGQAADPSTWPDLAAPGDHVTSPNPVYPGPSSRTPVGGGLLSPTEPRRAYTQVSGTSAAAAHAAGVTALVLQANPGLTPGEVEHLLETTAHELPPETREEGRCPIPYVRADATNPFSEANFAAGHGNVDAHDAVEAALSFDGIPDEDTAPPLEAVPADLDPSSPSVENIKRTFYATRDGGLDQTSPGPGAPGIHGGQAGDPITFTSKPLETGFSTSGMVFDFWAGSTLEYALTRYVNPEFQVTVERLPEDGGDAALVAETQTSTDGAPLLSPTARHAFATTGSDEDVTMVPTTFEPGDRIRLTVDIVESVGGTTAAVGDPLLRNFVVYSDAHPTPTRVQFGSTNPDPAFPSDAWCLADFFCSRLGGDLQAVDLQCAGSLRSYHLRWEGPPGSSATLECASSVASCQIPVTLQAETGTCTAEAVARSSITRQGECTYHIPDGSTGGDGYCMGRRAPG